MLKPNSFDDVKAPGEYVPVSVGGHQAVIKRVEETKSKNGKDMVVVLFDFAKTDSQPEYFSAEYAADIREDKKWPYLGRKYIMINDYKDENLISKSFKSFCSCVEKSNSGFTISWGEEWGKQFVGKKIGVVYGLEENEYNGTTSMRPAVKWFAQFDSAPKAEIPEPKYLKANAPAAAPTRFSADSDDLPF